MRTFAVFGVRLFCIAAVIALLTECSSGMISSSPSSRPDAILPLRSFTMSIRSHVLVGSAEYTVYGMTHDQPDWCMLKPPKRSLRLKFDQTWKGDITPETEGHCTSRPARFDIHFISDAGHAEGFWFRNNPSGPWELELKNEDGVCMVERGGPLDIEVKAMPASGKCPP
jgi:hypothetical protein